SLAHRIGRLCVRCDKARPHQQNASCCNRVRPTPHAPALYAENRGRASLVVSVDMRLQNAGSRARRKRRRVGRKCAVARRKMPSRAPRSMSFRIRLIFRFCFLEGRQLLAAGVYSHDFWKFVEGYAETPCICDLRHQTNVCESDMCSASIGPIREQAFKCSKSFGDPAVIPRVNLCLFMPELALEVLQGDEIIERMNIAGDQ